MGENPTSKDLLKMHEIMQKRNEEQEKYAEEVDKQMKEARKEEKRIDLNTPQHKAQFLTPRKRNIYINSLGG